MEESRYKAFAACSRFEEELEAYLEGEARPFILSHSRDCAPCGALLADFESICQAARELPQFEPSRLVWANVRATLVAEGAFGVPACAQFEGELEAYLEGEACPSILSHSRDCAPCGALLADLQSIRQAARELPQLEPSRVVWANVRATLAAEGAFGVAACAQFAAELEAYLEGEARPFILSHSRDCAPCGALLADLESIHEAARNLPLAEPSDALWLRLLPSLPEAVGQSVGGWRQIFSWRLFPQLVPVGVLAGLVLLASVLTLPSNSIQRWGGADEAAGSPAVVRIASAMPTGEDGALARVVSELEGNFRANEASMAPDLKATYEKSLVSLDGSIKECLDSLHVEPGNTLAHDYLLAAYTSKAEVLSSALEFEGR